MSSQSKTIQIFLPQGNPRGICSAEMTTRTVRVIKQALKLLVQTVQHQDIRQLQSKLNWSVDVTR